MGNGADQFPNLLVQQVVQDSANNLKFEEINVGLNIFDKVGLVVSRIEYSPNGGVWDEMTTAADTVICAFTSSDNLSTLAPNQAEVIDTFQMRRVDYGTAGNALINPLVITRDFSTLGGGGILVPPKPLYFAAHSTGLASAGTFDFRLYFRILRLSEGQYLELLESRRAFG
jgi:hypothetical protein